jgi:hypothetical protein
MSVGPACIQTLELPPWSCDLYQRQLESKNMRSHFIKRKAKQLIPLSSINYHQPITLSNITEKYRRTSQPA